jgi:bifunctional non-homologous end joining protein LigD
MEPVRWPEPFDHPDWLFQPKWDGVRILAHIGGADLRLFNRRGKERAAQYPEIAAALKTAFRGKSGLLDGEMTVFREGRPSFPGVMQRELAVREKTIAALARSLPATYLVFDLVYLDGHNLLGRGLEERQEVLRGCLEWAEPVLFTESFDRGTSLFAAVKERGWEGVVAKRRASSYHFGRSPLWRKIKARRQQLCAVGGFTVTGRGLGTLLLGVWRERDLVYVGRAQARLSEDERRLLAGFLSEMVQPHCPFAPAPRLGRVGVRWVRPELSVLVEYTEWTEGLKLRHPVILGVSPEPASVCRLL